MSPYVAFCLVFPDLIIQLGVVESEAQVGRELLDELTILLSEHPRVPLEAGHYHFIQYKLYKRNLITNLHG